MFAIDLEEDLTIAIGDDGGSLWPGLIQRVRRRPNGTVYVWGVVASGRTAGDPWRRIFSGGMSVVVLPAHYGVCHDCGALSPCPDEIAETDVRHLMDEADREAFIDLVLGPVATADIAIDSSAPLVSQVSYAAPVEPERPPSATKYNLEA
ncbi:hypothetical protein [Nocardia sp. IFM 10818]